MHICFFFVINKIDNVILDKWCLVEIKWSIIGDCACGDFFRVTRYTTYHIFNQFHWNSSFISFIVLDLLARSDHLYCIILYDHIFLFFLESDSVSKLLLIIASIYICKAMNVLELKIQYMFWTEELLLDNIWINIHYSVRDKSLIKSVLSYITYGPLQCLYLYVHLQKLCISTHSQNSFTGSVRSINDTLPLLIEHTLSIIVLSDNVSDQHTKEFLS